MSRRNHSPIFNLAEVLSRKVRVSVGGVPKLMDAQEAEIEKCVAKALKGDVRACQRFIRLCLRAGIMRKLEPEDDHISRIVVPKDWDKKEFMANYDRLGPPPWRGVRDGLTAEAREKLAANRKRGRKS